MGVFRYDSDLMLGIGRVADLAWLNILCFICSIPVFTFGAAVTAKYYVGMKLERGETVGVTKTFFHAFKVNFLEDLKATLILFCIYAFFGADWFLIIRSNASGMQTIFTGMLGIFSVMVLLITFCIFPMIARFQMTTFDSFRNALVFGVVHFPRVALGILMSVAPLVISIWYYKWAWLIWLFIATFALYYNSKFFVKSFDKLEERTFGPKEPEIEDPDYVLEDRVEDEIEAKTEAKTEAKIEAKTEAKIEDKYELNNSEDSEELENADEIDDVSKDN